MMIERNIKTVIVTGPTGAVGTALCSRLLQAGCTVVAVCRPGSPRAVALPKDANLYVVACDAANLLQSLDHLLQRKAQCVSNRQRGQRIVHIEITS